MKYNIKTAREEDIKRFLEFKKILGLDFKTIAEHLDRNSFNGIKIAIKTKRVKQSQLKIIRDVELNRLQPIFSLNLKNKDVDNSFNTLSKLTPFSNRRINKLLGKVSGNDPKLTLEGKKEVIEKRVSEILEAFQLIKDI